MVNKLTERIKNNLKTSFSDFAKASTDKKDFSGMGKMEKVNVIVSFLAMLELVKQGLVRVNQSKHFEDISIESENISIPTY
jgi:chromatin segregation and condensation protein Rec8/ScpA/Scc1 (kleisin family)